MRFLFLAVAFAAFLWLIDYYVYRNWVSFARYRNRTFRILTAIYRVCLFIMPLVLPAYLLLFRWWEVEPKAIRAAFVGFWAIYYLPKLPIVLVLIVKDATRILTWQFGWLKRERRESVEAAEDPGSDGSAPDLSELRSISRAEFLRRMGWTAASIPFVVVGYGVFRTLYSFEVREVTVRVPDLPSALEGIRIAQVSDLHAGSFFSTEPVSETVSIINELKPDLLMFTGDFVNNDENELNETVEILRRLNPTIGAFACLGNHDHYARVEQVAMRIAETPLKLLVNQHASLEINGARIYVIGTDNEGFNRHYADLPRATEGIPVRETDDLRILLTHDPSYWDHVLDARPDVDLTLSGHTHGGQVGFEFGPLKWSLARLMYPRWAGLYSEPHKHDGRVRHLYVNRGLGTVGPPIRIGIRPEITVLTLVRAASQA